MTVKTCPHCGAAEVSEDRWSRRYACGYTVNFDGPPFPCRNAKPAEPATTTTEPDMTDETLTAELEEFETLPAPLTAAQVTERELRRLETYKGAVLADPSDGKSAKRLHEMRKEVKGVRTAAANICRAEREEAIKTQREWVAVEKAIAERLEPVEDHLRDEAGRHDAWKAEQARLAEEARREKIRIRVEALVRIGAPLDMHAVETYDDAAWLAYLDQAEDKVAARREAEARAARLTEAGDECTADEAATLTEDQYAHRLTVAQQAQREREERARIEAEEKAEAARLEAQRRADQDRLAEELRADLERIAEEQRAENERLRRELEALQQPKVATPEPGPVLYLLPTDQMAEEFVRDRAMPTIQGLTPEPEPAEVATNSAAALDRIAVATWAQAALDSLVPPPEVHDVWVQIMADDAWCTVRKCLTSLRDTVRG